MEGKVFCNEWILFKSTRLWYIYFSTSILGVHSSMSWYLRQSNSEIGMRTYDKVSNISHHKLENVRILQGKNCLGTLVLNHVELEC